MIFEFKKVSLKFSKSKTNLFNELNLKFEGPGFISILGPSGCGKSTLLRLLAGLENPTFGKVEKPLNLKQGFIFQESHLLPWRNTFENVNLPLELQNISSPQSVQAALKAVGLENASPLYPTELSGGMKMRTSLARAFVTNPEILFCDEPFAALDEVTRETLQKELRSRVMETKKTCFFVTHNLSEALSVADQIYYFKSPGEIEVKPFIVDRSLDQNTQLEKLRTLVRGSFK